MRIVLADPPAYTPPYDHALAAALARAGSDVHLLTSPFRYGATPVPNGYTVDDTLYRRSSRIGHHRARVAVKAAEHPLALARLGLVRSDALHVQWVASPDTDAWLLRARSPIVFTAHDLLPRRTASHATTWRRLFGRFDAVVVHSERGRRTLAAFGVAERKLRVIPHPVFRSAPVRADDGNTVLALGVIREYKGLPDAVAAVLDVPGARLLVAGDPRIPLEPLRRAAGERAEWRLGYLGQTELDQSGALLQALGAGVPAVVYDVGGLGEIVGAFGAGRVVAPGDVAALAQAIRTLLHDADELAEARAGAARAREALTWDRSAEAHLELYRELA